MRRPSFTSRRRTQLTRRSVALEALEERNLITESLGILVAGIGVPAALVAVGGSAAGGSASASDVRNVSAGAEPPVAASRAVAPQDFVTGETGGGSAAAATSFPTPRAGESDWLDLVADPSSAAVPAVASRPATAAGTQADGGSARGGSMSPPAASGRGANSGQIAPFNVPAPGATQAVAAALGANPTGAGGSAISGRGGSGSAPVGAVAPPQLPPAVLSTGSGSAVVGSIAAGPANSAAPQVASPMHTTAAGVTTPSGIAGGGPAFAAGVGGPQTSAVSRPPVSAADGASTNYIYVGAPDADASEPGTDHATFSISRYRSDSDYSASLTVSYTVSGTATNGTDYNTLSGSATILANQIGASFDVVPIDDTLVEGDETVIVTGQAVSGYFLMNQSATVTIHDNDFSNPSLPIVTITATDPNAAETGPDAGQFTVTRTGATTDALAVQLTVAGSASDSDYSGSAPASTSRRTSPVRQSPSPRSKTTWWRATRPSF